MSHLVLIQKPRKKGVYVRCNDVDECLIVVDKETKRTPVGTRVTMLQETESGLMEPLAFWRVEKRGKARRYAANPEVWPRGVHEVREWNKVANRGMPSIRLKKTKAGTSRDLTFGAQLDRGKVLLYAEVTYQRGSQFDMRRVDSETVPFAEPEVINEKLREYSERKLEEWEHLRA